MRSVYARGSVRFVRLKPALSGDANRAAVNPPLYAGDKNRPFLGEVASLLDILAILVNADIIHNNSFLEASCAIMSFHVGGLFLTMITAP
jgi:hypothetical protein